MSGQAPLNPEEVHSVHNSERMSYRGCLRRWDWVFNQGYYPLTTAPPLEFGKSYHVAMEKYYNPSTWWMTKADEETRTTHQLAAIGSYTRSTREQLVAALRMAEGPQREDELRAEYQERIDLGTGMLKYYFSLAPQLDNFTPVKTEVGFEIPLINPDTEEPLWCRCPDCLKFDPDNGRPVTYGGRIDMLAEDPEGDYWIFDWKTAASIPDRNDFLETDDQITGYCCAFRKLGIPVKGFIYHEQRKAYPQPPKENATSRKGCRFSVNKQQATDYDTFIATVSKEDWTAFEAGFYDDFLDWLKESGPRFSRRSRQHRSPKRLENAYINMCREAMDMVAYREGKPVYPQHGRFNCSNCAFREPCIAQQSGYDYQYTLDTLYEIRPPYWLDPKRKEMSSDKSYRS